MLVDEGVEIHPKLRVDSLIARGSFGVVFRGHQRAVARDVAIKVLHPGLAPDTEPGRLFREEIRAIGTLDHPNVVRIFDADDTTDGRLYFVMELLEGPTLQQLADHGPIDPVRATKLVAQLLDGLAAVHAAGHIHADIKPSNAVVCGAGDEERVVLIDFGLSRVRPADRPAEAVGGTRAYMAPEQLRAWEVEARSDVFSAALVLVKLLTGRHRVGDEVAPALDGIDDPVLRAALENALHEEPSARPTAAHFARALRRESFASTAETSTSPFREFTPLTERDHDRLQGRSDDLQRLVGRIDATRAVVLTAPSGTGKTSLLRAGLIPYLETKERAWVYSACEPDAAATLAAKLDPTARTLREALERRSSRPVVVIVDQLEIALANGEAPALLEAILEARVPAVLGVREDYVARLLAATPALAEGVPQLRLLPLDRDGARDALVAPLARHEATMEPELLDSLLDDLSRVGREMGLDDAVRGAAIYPPHLQLVGAALFDALGTGERTITREHYRRLGGFAAIVGEHLDRTLGELSAEDRTIAREVFLTLVTSTQTRALRTENEIVDSVGVRHGEVALRRVLTRLEARRLITRTSSLDGVPSWSLVHDTLAPRIEAWLTVHDLDRRRIAEVVRFHLRVSQPDLPVLLSARDLRTIARFPGLLDELEEEWRRRSEPVWTPKLLVERSRRRLRSRRAVIASASVFLVALSATLVVSWLLERERRLRSEELRASNIGRIDLELAAFDWSFDANGALVVTPAIAPDLEWTLLDPDRDDPDAPGVAVPEERFERGQRQVIEGRVRETAIEVRGGDAFIAVSGRGTSGESCAPSIIPLRRLPGNAEYATPRPVSLQIPTCAASRFDTRAVPAGAFYYGGVGDPPSPLGEENVPFEMPMFLPAFAMDRTEITNAAFDVFSKMSPIHEVYGDDYSGRFPVAAGPRYPRSALDWFDARAYCRFLGKELPTTHQWQKALRGGIELATGPNPQPRRNVPWIDAPPSASGYAAIVSSEMAAAHMQLGQNADPRHPSPVGRHPKDTSVYGVVDLAGNVQEWTANLESGGTTGNRREPRITRGGNWFDTTPEYLDTYTSIENPRAPQMRQLFLGARCVE